MKKILYGIGQLGYSSVSQLLSNFTIFFGTAVLGLSGGVVGLIVFITVLWDAVSDPLVGHLSDNAKKNPLGKRHPFMIVAILGMSVCNICLWQISPNMNTVTKGMLLLLCVFLMETFNTCFSCPHGALGFDLANNEKERLSLFSTRSIFHLMGMLMPSVLLLVFSPLSQNGKIGGESLVKMGYAASMLCLFFGTVCIIGTFGKERKIVTQEKIEEKNETMKALLKTFISSFGNFEKRKLIVGYAVSMLSTAFLSASGLHMFTYSFHFNQLQISILMLSLFSSAIASQAVWQKLAKTTSKTKLITTALKITAVGILLLGGIFLKVPNPTTAFFVAIVVMMVCGFGIGALFSLPISAYGDILAKEKNGNSSGTEFGFLSLSLKIANAFGLLGVGLLLDFVKFDASHPVQPIAIQQSLVLIVLGGIVLSLIASIVIFKKSESTEKKIEIKTNRSNQLYRRNHQQRHFGRKV